MVKALKALGTASIFVVTALLLLVLNVNNLQAQTQTGTISGTATDSSGAALVGAAVTVTNEGTGAAQNLLTDAEGRYKAAELPAWHI